MAAAFLCVDFAFIHADMRLLSRVAECTVLGIVLCVAAIRPVIPSLVMDSLSFTEGRKSGIRGVEPLWNDYWFLLLQLRPWAKWCGFGWPELQVTWPQTVRFCPARKLTNENRYSVTAAGRADVPVPELKLL